MPTYDYVCSSCGHAMEVVHGVHGHGPAACPVCGGPMRKAFTAPAVHFKGTGWAKKERGSSRGAGSKAAAGRTDAAKSEGSSGTSGSDTAGSTGGASGTNATAPDAASSRTD